MVCRGDTQFARQTLGLDYQYQDEEDDVPIHVITQPTQS